MYEVDQYVFTEVEFQKAKICPFCKTPHFDITMSILFTRCTCGAVYRPEFDEQNGTTSYVWYSKEPQTEAVIWKDVTPKGR